MVAVRMTFVPFSVVTSSSTAPAFVASASTASSPAESASAASVLAVCVVVTLVTCFLWPVVHIAFSLFDDLRELCVRERGTYKAQLCSL